MKELRHWDVHVGDLGMEAGAFSLRRNHVASKEPRPKITALARTA